MSPNPETSERWRAALAAGQRDLRGWNLDGQDGQDLDLSFCQLQHSGFREARCGHARLHQAQVQGGRFQRALFWGADLSGLQAEDSFWQEADLSGSRLQGAIFDRALLHRTCLQGVVAADSRWRQARLVEADFRSGLDQLTDLGGADFHGADLSFAVLQGANLQAATLELACCYGTDLRGCDLRGAILRGCDLRDSLLEGAQLDGADLAGALLPEVEDSGAEG